MRITVKGRRMSVSDSLRAYADSKVGSALKVIDIDPLEAEVVLSREKNPSRKNPAACEVTIFLKGHVVRAEEHEEDLHAAIDVAAAKVERQLRKFKTRVIDRKIRMSEGIAELPPIIESAGEDGELDFDKLMDDLSDDEIVRVKEVEFLPMTEEQALVQIDLLGHDFFAYTDRDTNLVNVLYRRKNGGYGLLKQK